METSAYRIARQFIDVKETPGPKATPLVLAWLQLDDTWPTDDAVPWCSAFVNFIAFLLELPRSKSLAARSWLQVGRPITLDEARPDNDVVVLERDGGGHVGWFAGLAGDQVQLLGGNQHDAVNVSAFPRSRVLGVRRLEKAA